ncbi:hypothetical protein [Streptomyces sp. P9-A2]|uniref:hypothetical protein n=1 Tax=Streptomyces sp. P9-A2 TaxID=3072284 RepID=UPI002FCB17CC
MPVIGAGPQRRRTRRTAERGHPPRDRRPRIGRACITADPGPHRFLRNERQEGEAYRSDATAFKVRKNPLAL